MPDDALDLKSLVVEHSSSNFSPSGMVAVARGGRVVQFEPWGQDGYAPDSQFRVASCTKSFTALALLVLRRAGKLNLDDELTRHLPELKVVAGEGWPALRVRHLLSMSGGLATDNPWGDRQESISRQQLVAWLQAGLRLIFPPGSAYEYSNLGYAILGELISRVSGQDYRQFVKTQILEPLGLSDTRFIDSELGRVVPSYHREVFLPGQQGGWAPHAQSGPGAFSPIGGLYSSAVDLAKWANTYLERQVPGGVGFAAADLLEAQQPLTALGSSGAEAPLHGMVTTGYGYGLKIEEYAQHGKLVSHAGGYPGFTAYMCWHERSGYAVFASGNGTHSAAPQLARKAMLQLIAANHESKKTLAPWPETTAAVAAIDEFVRAVAAGGAAWQEPRFDGLFAENVELDFPLARRVAYIRQALIGVGQLRPTRTGAAPDCDRPCRAAWNLPTELGRLELFVELMPVAPYALQTFSVVAVNGGERVKLF